VIERGRRYPKGSFPRDFGNLTKGWLWHEGDGLFELKPINEMLVVQGAGYGGGSLIYANVHLRAPADVFAAGWPTGYSRAALDPYYDLVAYMLDIAPITTRPRSWVAGRNFAIRISQSISISPIRPTRINSTSSSADVPTAANATSDAISTRRTRSILTTSPWPSSSVRTLRCAAK
jgi:choline dehydrogenase-like flavoprotein